MRELSQLLIKAKEVKKYVDISEFRWCGYLLKVHHEIRQCEHTMRSVRQRIYSRIYMIQMETIYIYIYIINEKELL